MKKLKVVLIGAGDRGIVYTDIMSNMKDKFEVVAVAEPRDSRRNYIKETHGIPEDRCFKDWKPLFDLGKIADVALITTMDREHFKPAMKAISLHYDILLEKPISDNPLECKKIADAAEEAGVKIVVCTVLRYTSLFTTLKNLIDDGKIGEVMSINHEECVGNVHQSHSFVRGNWGNEERSSCMILQKSCHDMDILQWLTGKQLKMIQSFGTLTYFTKQNAPDGAPDYCIDGCPKSDSCPYNSVKLYLEDKENNWFRNACTKKVSPSDAEVEEAMRTTQYGKCVFKCDNDVVDHQTVNMLFEGDVTATFTMNAFNQGGRFIHIMGTKGELHAALGRDVPIKFFDFKTRKEQDILLKKTAADEGSHSGGDRGIIIAFYDYILGIYTGKSIPTIRQSANNHLMAFAAEQSRKNNTVVDFTEYINSLD